jgi:uncharacterized protein with von Willebrand factor type A (vWA) domain
MKSLTTLKVFGLIAAVFLFTGCSNASNPTTGSTTSTTVGTTTDTSTEPSDEQAGSIPAKGSATSKQQGTISLRRNFYFVFDGSGSMQHPPKNPGKDADRTGRKIDGAKWAVHEFLKKVPEDVNLGLYVFDRNGKREEVALGPNNRTEFLAAIDAVKAGGDTPLGNAIGKGSNALWKQYQKQLGYGEYRLIVITDGEATDYLPSGVNLAKQHKTPIYTIGFDMDQDHELRKHSISYRSADSATEVEQALEEAAAELDMFDPTAFPAEQTAKRN